MSVTMSCPPLFSLFICMHTIHSRAHILNGITADQWNVTNALYIVYIHTPPSKAIKATALRIRKTEIIRGIPLCVQEAVVVP